MEGAGWILHVICRHVQQVLVLIVGRCLLLEEDSNDKDLLMEWQGRVRAVEWRIVLMLQRSLGYFLLSWLRSR